MSIKAKLIKRWEEDATRWTPDQKAAIKFARQCPDDEAKLFCCYAKGTEFEGEKAEMLIAAGLAVEITE
jgi:hypothetical protein